VRLRAAEKAEVIRLVEGSELSVRRTLAELGVHRSTFYAWYRRYAEAGEAGLVVKKPAAQRCAADNGIVLCPSQPRRP
jgi:putative transposase